MRCTRGALELAVGLLIFALPSASAECEIPRNGTRTEICEYVRAPVNEWCELQRLPPNCATPRRAQAVSACTRVGAELCPRVARRSVSDGWFPFLECFYCWVDTTAAQVGVFVLFLVWVCLLLYVLATTADMYFAPATVQLSDWLGLRPRVAGVTLLALGNGAPDVFSVLAAYRAGQGDLAVGALGPFPAAAAPSPLLCPEPTDSVPTLDLGLAVGGSMFVTTVVVGAVITASGGSVKATGMFVRDIAFNLIGSTALFFMCLSERATLYEAGGLFAAYLVYVLAVTQGHRFPPMLKADRAAWYARKEAEAADISETAPLLGDPGIDNLRKSLSVGGSTDDTADAAADLDDRGRRTSIQGVEPVVMSGGGGGGLAGGAKGTELADETCWAALQRRLVTATEWCENEFLCLNFLLKHDRCPDRLGTAIRKAHTMAVFSQGGARWVGTGVVLFRVGYALPACVVPSRIFPLGSHRFNKRFSSLRSPHPNPNPDTAVALHCTCRRADHSRHPRGEHS